MNNISTKELQVLRDIVNKSKINLNSSFSVRKVQSKPVVYKIEYGNKALAVKILSFRQKDYTVSSHYFYKQAYINGINVPRLLCTGTDKIRCWIIYKWVEGRILSQLPTKKARFNSAVEVGKLLKKLHLVKISKTNIVKKQMIENNLPSNYHFFISKINSFLQKGVKILTAKDIKKLFKITAVLQYEPNKPSLLHGDVTGGNVVISTKKNSPYFFDPGKTVSGDPMCDLGYTQTSLVSTEFRTGVFNGYTLNIRLSTEEYHRLELWKLLRQAVITYRAKYQAESKSKILTHKKYLQQMLKIFGSQV